MKSSEEICDKCCKKSGELTYKSEGWIHFERLEFRYSTGSAYVSKSLNQMDFCSMKCFNLFLKSLVQ